MAPPRPPADTHEWVSFEDRHEERTWLFDATFLTSRWTCIFGQGCQGVLTGPAPELVQGCCSYGAHFVDDEDVARVEAAADRLTPEQWQFAGRARSAHGGVVRRTRRGETVTRLVDDACIFLNRPGFAAGPGCALHQAALAAGDQPLEWKPEVCWQLPLRREDHVEADGHVTSIVRQWDRRHWGGGGDEFHWWCTEAPDAFVGEEPVYRSMAAELQALVGRVAYRDLVATLEARTASSSGQRTPLPHPAVRRGGRAASGLSRRADPARRRGGRA